MVSILEALRGPLMPGTYYSDDSMTRRRLGLDMRGDVTHCTAARWQFEQGDPRSHLTYTGESALSYRTEPQDLD